MIAVDNLREVYKEPCRLHEKEISLCVKAPWWIQNRFVNRKSLPSHHV